MIELLLASESVVCRVRRVVRGTRDRQAMQPKDGLGRSSNIIRDRVVACTDHLERVHTGTSIVRARCRQYIVQSVTCVCAQCSLVMRVWVRARARVYVRV